MSVEFQLRLLEEVKNRNPDRPVLVRELSALLHLGNDAIYRRLRGDSLLTPSEIRTIALHYNISLDHLIFEGRREAQFSYNPLTQKDLSLDQYLSNVLNEFAIVENASQAQVFYAASELPIFHYAGSPLLFKFKLYVWGRTTWNLDYLVDRQFEKHLFPPFLDRLTERIFTSYGHLDSHEIWGMDIIDNTLNQIVYHFESGMLGSKSIAGRLFDELANLLERIEQMTKTGEKLSARKGNSTGARFDLYHNEMLFTNNMILISTDEGRRVFSSFTNPNYISTSDARVCAYIVQWFDSITERSVAISHSAEKNRRRYFGSLRNKLTRAREHIDKL
jgi:hypothetical protein